MIDLRFLARRKVLAAIAILTIGLALGANTAALSVLDAFLRSSLGFPEPQRVVVVAPERNMPGRGSVVFNDAWLNYQLLRRVQHTFSDVAAVVQSSVSWADHSDTRQLDATRATASYFATMRVQPMLGRPFTESEEGPNPAPVVILSHALWTAAFDADPRIIGATLSINGAPHRVVGVMPPGFSQPTPTDVWLPFDIPANQRSAISGARQITIFGRLVPGKSLETGRKDMDAFTQRALQEDPKDNKDFRYNITTLRDTLLSGADSSVLFVLAAAAGLFLLAILNLGSLLIAWGFERRQEMSVRLALGASETRIVRLLLDQSVAVVAAGGVFGVLLAFAMLGALRSIDLGPTINPFIAHARLDLPVLGVAAVITLLAGLLAGSLPAVFMRGTGLADALRSASRTATLSPRAMAWQKGMVITQSAVSVVILAVAVLIGVSFWRLSTVPIGFVSHNRIVAHLVLPDASYDKHSTRAAFGRALAGNLAHEADIVRGGFTTTLPVGDQLWGGRFFVELPDGSPSPEPILFHIRRVSPSYLSAMGIPLLRGRDFTAGDDTGSVTVAIVSRALADRLWPKEEAVGKRLMRAVAGSTVPQLVMVIGVAGNTMDAGSGSPPGEAIYIPYAQVSAPRISIVAESRGDQAATVAGIKRALHESDPAIAAGSVTTLDALVVQANALPRLRAYMLLIFAGIAVGLVALGNYGVMSQLVSSRERELAVRLVFGAAPGQLGRSIISQVTRLTIPGIAIGLGAVVMLRGALKTFVFSIAPTSAAALAIAGVALLALAIAAAAPSAIRAMRVDVRRGISGA
ncbi:MAG TPA: ABC transporter permease [Gemmatimonadaceae bacterium]|jgi:putative ABC transport system permease protein|nr:ABC transporter permease [Gemmatimonadaceae bacterium]